MKYILLVFIIILISFTTKTNAQETKRIAGISETIYSHNRNLLMKDISELKVIACHKRGEELTLRHSYRLGTASGQSTIRVETGDSFVLNEISIATVTSIKDCLGTFTIK